MTMSAIQSRMKTLHEEDEKMIWADRMLERIAMEAEEEEEDELDDSEESEEEGEEETEAADEETEDEKE
jgi:hypothetical protein